MEQARQDSRLQCGEDDLVDNVVQGMYANRLGRMEEARDKAS